MGKEQRGDIEKREGQADRERRDGNVVGVGEYGDLGGVEC